MNRIGWLFDRPLSGILWGVAIGMIGVVTVMVLGAAPALFVLVAYVGMTIHAALTASWARRRTGRS